MSNVDILTGVSELEIEHYWLINEKTDLLDEAKEAEIIQYARIAGSITLHVDWCTEAGIKRAMRLLRKAHDQSDTHRQVYLGLVASPWFDAPWTQHGYSRIGMDGKRITDPVTDTGSEKESGYVVDLAVRLSLIRDWIDADNAAALELGCDCCLVAVGMVMLDAELWRRIKGDWANPSKAAECAAQVYKHGLIQTTVDGIFPNTFKVNYGLFGCDTTDTSVENRSWNPFFPPDVDLNLFTSAGMVTYGCDTVEMWSMIESAPATTTHRFPVVSLDMAHDPEGGFTKYPVRILPNSDWCTLVGQTIKPLNVVGVYIYHGPFDTDVDMAAFPANFAGYVEGFNS